MSDISSQSFREYIIEHNFLPDFARIRCGLPVYKPHDRCRSLKPGAPNSKDLEVWEHSWYDFRLKVGGSVIELLAWAKYGGDVGLAMQELGAGFWDFTRKYARNWEAKTRAIHKDCGKWHSNLREVDRWYLHQRGIDDDTIERLQIGYDPEDSKDFGGRLVFPCFKNGRMIYFASRETATYTNRYIELKANEWEKNHPDEFITSIEPFARSLGLKFIPNADDLVNGNTEKGIAKGTLPKYKNLRLKSKNSPSDETLTKIPWGLHTLSRRKGSNEEALSSNGIDKSQWFIVCEGIVDAVSFEQAGWCVNSPMSGSVGRSELKEFISNAKAFPNVLIIFDNDDAGSQFQRKTAKEFFKNGIHFFCGTVPDSFDGKPVKDVNDFYVAGGDLADLVKSATPGLDWLAGHIDDKDELKEMLRQCSKYTEFSDLVILFELIKKRSFFDSLWLKALLADLKKAPGEASIVKDITAKHNLLYLEGEGFYEYSCGVWQKKHDTFIKGYADQELGRFAANQKMTNIMNFLKARCFRSRKDLALNSQPVFNLSNGIILLDTENAGKFVPHDDSYYSSIQMAFNYDPDARAPRWEKFIEEVSSDDHHQPCQDKINLIQEMCGYILCPHNRWEKAFFLKGEGGNGKGILIDTLRMLFGEDNCTSLDLSDLSGPFNPILIQHSLANFASESKVDLRGFEQRFKAAVSGNYITAAHKGVDAIQFSNRCKFITSCNEFFHSNEVDIAFLRRLCFIEFKHSFTQNGTADLNLIDKLKEELPGIFNWCLKGYMRLLKNNGFTQTDEDKKLKNEFMENTSPIASFFNEKIDDWAGTTKSSAEIYASFKSWCEANGYKTWNKNTCTVRFRQFILASRKDIKPYQASKMWWYDFPDYQEELQPQEGQPQEVQPVHQAQQEQDRPEEVQEVQPPATGQEQPEQAQEQQQQMSIEDIAYFDAYLKWLDSPDAKTGEFVPPSPIFNCKQQE